MTDLIEYVPPHDLDAEANVLAAVLMDPTLYEVLAPYVANAMHGSATRAGWEAMTWLRSQGQPIDPALLVGRMRDLGSQTASHDFHAWFSLVCGTGNAEHYARRVHDLYLRRRIREVCTSFARQAHELADETGSELVQRCARALAEVADATPCGSGKTFRELLDEVYDVATSARGEDGWTSSLKGLHSMVPRFGPGELIVVLARPSHGKTTLGATLALDNARHGVSSSVVFSTEERDRRFVRRLVAPAAGMPKSRLRDGGLSEADALRLRGACDKMAGLPVIVDRCESTTFQHLRAQALRYKRLHGDVGCVILDHAQRIRFAGTRGDRSLEVEEIARGSKQLAEEIDAPVFLLSQVPKASSNMSTEATRPSSDSGKHSAALDEESDCTLGVWYRHKAPKGADDVTEGVVEIEVLKQRDGRTGGRFLHTMDGSLLYDESDSRSWRQCQAYRSKHVRGMGS